MTEPTITRRPRGKRTAVPDAATLSSGSSTSTTELLGAPAHPRLLETTVLHPHPANPPHRSDSDFEELAAAIEADGEITDALTVRPSPTIPGEYEVLNGHRRLAAAQSIGMVLVPVRVKDLDDAAALITVLGANQNRKDFTPLEEARLVQATLDLPGMTQKRIAEGVGKSTSWVSQRAHAAKTPARILDALADKHPTFDQLDAIAEFDGTEDAELLIQAVGTRDFSFRLQRARDARERAKAERAIKAALKKAGVKAASSNWGTPEGYREAKQFTNRSQDAATELAAVLTELGADRTWRYRENYYIYLYRPLTEKERASEAKKAEKNAAARAALELRSAQITALLETVSTAAKTRLTFLRDVLTTRKITPAQHTIVSEYFLTKATTELITDSYARLSTYSIREVLPDVETDAQRDWANGLSAAARTLLLAATYGEGTAHHPEYWLDRILEICAWYDVLVALGYTPSTAELDALATPEAQAA